MSEYDMRKLAKLLENAYPVGTIFFGPYVPPIGTWRFAGYYTPSPLGEKNSRMWVREK